MSPPAASFSRMSSDSALTRAVAIVAVFGVALAAGNALGKDDEPEPAREVARTSAPALGPLRLEPAPALPDLRAVRERRRREPPPAPVPTSGAPAPPSADTDQGDVAVQAPVSPVQPVTPPAPAPTSPSPAPPPVESSPEPAGPPAPDPAPAPAPAPAPDPSPRGGSGQFSGGG
jgi:hypothetical protein